MVKIDTRRLQDKKKKHFEYECERRNDKKETNMARGGLEQQFLK